MLQVTFKARPRFHVVRFTERYPISSVALRIVARTDGAVDVLAIVAGPARVQRAFVESVPEAAVVSRPSNVAAYRLRVLDGPDSEFGAFVDELTVACGGCLVLDRCDVAFGAVTGQALALSPKALSGGIASAARGGDSALARADFRVTETHPYTRGTSPGGVELTHRESETLRLALSMGYYRSPRGCTMEDIATRLGLTKSAVYHRMNSLERKAVGRLAGLPHESLLETL